MSYQRSFLRVLVFTLGFGLTASLAHAEERPVAVPPTPQAPGPDAANVTPDTPVITLDGLCDPPTVIGSIDKTPCRTVVTRSEFEKLADAVGAASIPAKAKLATLYVQSLHLAREAQKRGLDKDPRFQGRLELARNQALGQVLLQDVKAKSGQFAPGELETFFRDNAAQFEEATLLRVFIPNTKFQDTDDGTGRQAMPETAPEMKRVAEAIYWRARDGADFQTLQKEAFEAANLKEEPDVNLGKMTRDHLRQSHRSVFDLKLGEPSTLIEEPDEGYYIYKVVSKVIPPFESIKTEVERALQAQRMDNAMKTITGSAQAKLNERYFGPAAALISRTQ